MENKGNKVKDYLLNLLESIIIGALIGAIVGLYQLGMSYVTKGSAYFFNSRNIWLILVMVVLVATASFINHMILHFAPSLEGSGIPNIEVAIREQKKIDWKKEIVLMMLNSYASSFAGFPLGSEGPSVVIGGKTAEMVESIGKIGDDDTIAMACGTGFGCAFLSPLAGICYIFEESLHHFSWKFVLRGILMMGSAFGVTYFINHHHLLHLVNCTMPSIKDYYVFAMLIVVNVIIGVGFTHTIIAIKKLCIKYKETKFMKNRDFLFFGIILVVNFFCYSWMGSGGSLISNIMSFKEVYLVAIILLIRFVATCLAGNARVTGGLVIPMMTLGCLTGQIVCLVSTRWFGLSPEVYNVIILVSMCMIFAIITRTPITSLALIYSAIAYSSGDYLHALIILPIAAVSIFCAVYLAKATKTDDLYEEMIECGKKLTQQ